MNNDYTNGFIIHSLGLPHITDLESLSNSIGVSKTLLYLLTNKTNDYYTSFSIPKKNGEERKIDSPKYSLKLIQKWILVEILEKIPVSDEAMAFKKGFGIGIKKNAEYHSNSSYLLQLDLKDFFYSIKRRQVFYLFKNLGYNMFVSNLLTNLCTYKESLPQGGICSPYLSNLISIKLDARLVGLCSRRDILYTRYADDLTFSCDNKIVLQKVKKVIEDIVVDEGYKVNHNKTRLLSPSSHKLITGITVNDGYIKASKKLKKKVRAMIHNAIVRADYSKVNQIRGYISFINSIEVGYETKVVSYINELTKKDYRMFREVVDSYNSNQIINGTDKMVYEEIELMGIDDDFELDDLLGERVNFLKEKNCKVFF